MNLVMPVSLKLENILLPRLMSVTWMRLRLFDKMTYEFSERASAWLSSAIFNFCVKHRKWLLIDWNRPLPNSSSCGYEFFLLTVAKYIAHSLVFSHKYILLLLNKALTTWDGLSASTSQSAVLTSATTQFFIREKICLNMNKNQAYVRPIPSLSQLPTLHCTVMGFALDWESHSSTTVSVSPSCLSAHFFNHTRFSESK